MNTDQNGGEHDNFVTNTGNKFYICSSNRTMYMTLQTLQNIALKRASVQNAVNIK